MIFVRTEKGKTMPKNVNDLSENDFAKVRNKLLSMLSATNKGIFKLAEAFDLDKNELYSWWLLLQEEYSSRDLNSKKGLTFEEGMRMMKRLLRIWGRNDGLCEEDQKE